MEIRQNVPLAPLTTFKVGGPARYFIEARSEADVKRALDYAHEQKLPVFVLGGGSNLVISDEGWPGLVIHIAIGGIERVEANGKALFRVGAGEDWDGFVAASVNAKCGGIECLSGIPGTVGGTPVQNVGAYGQEVSETITQVRSLDISTGKTREFTNDGCDFSYRTSVFNSTQRGRYIVLEVDFALIPGAAPRIQYADLKKYFASHTAIPTLSEARDAVRAIRHSKAMLIMPNDEDCRSAGSFFKNPVLTGSEFADLDGTVQKMGKAIPSYPANDGKIKVSAAWLVENAGFHKGFTLGPVGISRKHALAIVNRGGAKASDIVALKDKVQQGVKGTFGIELHPEPVFVGIE